jgi:glyceraldehyde 3-phosphate dehydrogenase
MIKIAINGFGRIGRVTFRAALEKYADQLEVVAINTSGSMEASGWAHLLRFDSVYGKFSQEVSLKPGEKGEIGRLLIGSREYPVLAQPNPDKIPWENYGVEVVLECTGVFRTSKEAGRHLRKGVKKVIISAPAKDETPTFVIGANEEKYQGEVISNASCTTNCVAPIAKIMADNFKVTRASMTTIHAYTAEQELVDGSHKDIRRARAAALNIIPATTGAAEALVRVLPFYKGKFEGSAVRVPVACGSLADLVFLLDQTVRKERVNRVLEQASGESRYQGIIAVTNEPIVSSDIIGHSASAIIDLPLTSVVGGNLVELIAWYDNEWAYSCRLIEMAILAGEHR